MAPRVRLHFQKRDQNLRITNVFLPKKHSNFRFIIPPALITKNVNQILKRLIICLLFEKGENREFEIGSTECSKSHVLQTLCASIPFNNMFASR